MVTFLSTGVEIDGRRNFKENRKIYSQKEEIMPYNFEQLKYVKLEVTIIIDYKSSKIDFLLLGQALRMSNTNHCSDLNLKSSVSRYH